MIGYQGGASRRRTSCREVARHLQSCLDGEADELTARRIAVHVEECRRCGLEAAVCQEIKNALARQEIPNEIALARLRTFGTTLLTDGLLEVQDEAAGWSGPLTRQPSGHRPGDIEAAPPGPRKRSHRAGPWTTTPSQ
ncbi:zf-HC2 domain-containing protein [Streptomyces sp. NPDC058067]|uniref:zf-HC2 domain-containing protein n=1 Tax=Streptomyces sp. NPDC058067 TaxID=3346324 RepID=UPI0036E682FD